MLHVNLPGTCLHSPQRSSKQNVKVPRRHRLFSSVARRPTELRFKEHRDSLCKGGCGLPAGGTTSLRAVTGKPPSFALTAPSDKAPGPAQGLPASPGVALSNFGRGRHSGPGTPSRPRPHPRSPLGFVPLQTHLPRAPKPRHLRQPCQSPSLKGQRRGKERNSRHGVPRSAHSPSSERGTEGLQSPQRHDSAAPQRRTERHSPMQSPRGGGPQGAGFRGITGTLESGVLVSGGTPPTSLGCGRRQ